MKPIETSDPEVVKKELRRMKNSGKPLKKARGTPLEDEIERIAERAKG